MPIDSRTQRVQRVRQLGNALQDITDLKNLTKALFELNPQDQSEENRSKGTSSIKERAVFYPIAQRMANGMQSLLFAKEPELTVNPALEHLSDNADGYGNSVYQQCSRWR